MLSYRKYEHSESAPWVIFVHGAGGSSVLWFLQIKEFKKHFNILLVDLRGHGKSASDNRLHVSSKYTLEVLAGDIIEVMDNLKIEKAHFLGMSLGTILMRQISENHPHRVLSMIMGGAIVRLNFRAKFLVVVGNKIKRLIPYIWLYRLFAWIIMPSNHHKTSRNLFIQEAKKVAQKEFIRWFQLTHTINPILKYFQEKDTGIPTLYLMGSEDYMFLPAVEMLSKQHPNSTLKVVENSGHVCNIDQPQTFNNLAISFISKN